MIDILLIIGLTVSHIGFLSTGYIFNSCKEKKKTKLIKVEPQQVRRLTTNAQPVLISEDTPTNTEVGSFEVVCEDVPVVTMTSEEHCKFLAKKYPEAVKDYRRHLSSRRVVERSDRYIMRLIVAAEAGDLDVVHNQHTLDFSNGDEIWISNKYYSYGNLYHSEDNPHCCFSSENGTLSLYTFLRLVDFEETFFEPVIRLKNKTIRVK